MRFSKPALQALIFGIGALAFFDSGALKALHSSVDFVPIYTGSSCVLHGCNPYDTLQLEGQYFIEGGKASELVGWDHETPVYPPSALLALSPLAMVPFPAARLIWLLVNGALFITAVALILTLCPEAHRLLAVCLGAFLLAGSYQLLVLGQPATFSIALAAIGAYFILRGRYLTLAAILLMLSVAVKPQIGGLIVLYLLVRGVHRRYAAGALAGALALLAIGGLILKMNPASAGWVADLRGNVAGTQVPGAINDPGPANKFAIGNVSLQPVTSVILPTERLFNGVAYALFGLFFVAWAVAVLRMKPDLEGHLLAIGSLSVLTLLPVYHRFYDSRLLLLSLPAAMIVFQRRRILGAALGILTVLATISLQYRVQVFLENHGKWDAILGNKILFVLLLREQNLALVAILCLYLVAFFTARSSRVPAQPIEAVVHGV